MELWFAIIVTLCIAALLKPLISSVCLKTEPKIPPGPLGIPIITRIQWLGRASTDIEATLRKLCSKFGPIVTIPVGKNPVIFVSSRVLAHEALVHSGSVFADRPKPPFTAKILNSNQHNISSASYGPNWRLFRRNLTAHVLHPSKAKDFGHARKWTLEILLEGLRGSSGSDYSKAVMVKDHIRYAMFCLLVFMCFGEKLDEKRIREIETVQVKLLTSFNRFAVLNLLPFLTRVLFRKRWNELWELKRKQEEVLGPKIRARMELHEEARMPDIQSSSRPKPPFTAKILNSNQHNISSACYGPNWRLYRRNLTAHVLHPSKAKDFGHARKWTLEILLEGLRGSSGSGYSKAVMVKDHIRYAMFCLFVFMCFGEKLDEKRIREIEAVQVKLLTSFNRFRVLNFFPSLTRVLFWKRLNELWELKRKQEKVLGPKIRARMELHEEARMPDVQNSSRLVNCYVDSLLAMDIPEGDTKRKLTLEQLVSFCSEFLNAGTDTTSTALQWIMANLVKYPKIQLKLFDEIKQTVGDKADEVEEEDLSQMPYLKAVVLEGLRRHPPGHFLLPHTVTHDTNLGGYLVPKNAIINFMVADVNMDPEIWVDPDEFRPERFLRSDGSCEEFDITGSREIKMMPFGAGRRVCPGLGLAMLHLEYYVANLVWKFEWKAIDGDEVDLSEKQEFTTVMKNPLKAHISPRQKYIN